MSVLPRETPQESHPRGGDPLSPACWTNQSHTLQSGLPVSLVATLRA